MQHIVSGYTGFNLLFSLNWDRILYLATILAALMLGAYVGAL